MERPALARALLALAAACTAVVAGCGNAADRAPSLRISGGTSAQRQLLRDLAVRIDVRAIRELRLSPPSARGGGVRLELVGDRGAAAYVEEALVVTEFIRQSHRRGLPFIGSVAFDTGAARSDVSSLFGDADPPPSRQGVAAYVRRIRDAATEAHARIEELRTPAAAYAGLVLRIRMVEPARFLKNRAQRLADAIATMPPQFLGYVIEAVDGSGARFLRLGALPRGRIIDVLPSLAGCGAVVDHSRPYGVTVPRCPA